MSTGSTDCTVLISLLRTACLLWLKNHKTLGVSFLACCSLRTAVTKLLVSRLILSAATPPPDVLCVRQPTAAGQSARKNTKCDQNTRAERLWERALQGETCTCHLKRSACSMYSAPNPSRPSRLQGTTSVKKGTYHPDCRVRQQKKVLIIQLAGYASKKRYLLHLSLIHI